MKLLQLTFIILLILSCSEKKQAEYTPWGELITDSITPQAAGTYTIQDIIGNGEMIMLTMSGPESYYDYHGRGMGTQYRLCERLAEKLGVSLRVDVCKTKEEMLSRLKNGDGDIIAYQIEKKEEGTVPCGYGTDSTAWAVSSANKELADTINGWYSPSLLAEVKREERTQLSVASVHRHVYAPMLNSSRGEISQYDHLFQRYAPIARWDWRLMAAQCYQESCFDPKAYSWAGARGLMQIMPATAAHLGLAEDKMYDPEENIYAAARYIAELSKHFQDVRNPMERQLFVLASYNGGYFHIRDAMRLAEKYGKDKHRWDDVAPFILNLQTPQYYNDPVVKYGYMRGTETVGYVARIRDRWRQYRGVARGGSSSVFSFPAPGTDAPHKATKKHRFKL